MLGCFGCLKSAIMICNDPHVLEVDGGRRSLEIQIGQDNQKNRGNAKAFQGLAQLLHRFSDSANGFPWSVLEDTSYEP